MNNHAPLPPIFRVPNLGIRVRDRPSGLPYTTSIASWNGAFPNIRSQVCHRPIQAPTGTLSLKLPLQITHLLHNTTATRKREEPTILRLRRRLLITELSRILRDQLVLFQSIVSVSTIQRATTAAAAEVWRKHQQVRLCLCKMGATINPSKSNLTAMYP